MPGRLQEPRRRRACPRRCLGPWFGPADRRRRSPPGRAGLRGAGGDRPLRQRAALRLQDCRPVPAPPPHPAAAPSTVSVWWLTPRWRSRGSASDRRGESERREAEGEGGVGAVEGCHAAVAQAGLGADDAWARADDRRVPAEAVGGGVERAGDRERLVLAAVGRRRRDVTAEQAALAQLGDVAAERAGQGAARRLHVAEPSGPASPAPPPMRPAPGGRAEAGPGPASSVPVRLSHSCGWKGAPEARLGSTGCWSEV